MLSVRLHTVSWDLRLQKPWSWYRGQLDLPLLRQPHLGAAKSAARKLHGQRLCLLFLRLRPDEIRNDLRQRSQLQLWKLDAILVQPAPEVEVLHELWQLGLRVWRAQPVLWLMEQIILDAAQPQRVVRRLRLQYNRDWLAQLFLWSMVKIRRYAAQAQQNLLRLR